MTETSTYAPNPEFVAQANVSGMEAYRELYRRAEETPEEFWAEVAEGEIDWFEKWSHVFEWNPPFAKWFVGAKTNVAYNCLDRHLKNGRAQKIAILWEGEPGDERKI
ncbi:MAG: acetyl-coenzyme A synthetase, partial [Bryobacteraceae bacterium]|nr:acetyl-coenzyme A synthetase [Bryobacteraceae bacterium]